MFSLKKRVFLIGSCQSVTDTEILETISTELKYTIRNAGQKAKVNTISDLKGEKFAKIINKQYSNFSSRNTLISPEIVSDIGLWSIKDVLEKSDVLILVFNQSSEIVYSWLSVKNPILSRTPITCYRKIDSLLTRPLYF